jgi:hypothetical protein
VSRGNQHRNTKFKRHANLAFDQTLDFWCMQHVEFENATLEQLMFVTKMRWRIERDYQDLKQEFGLGHYEGRGWRGFHHHASLSIAAYGFLMAQRLGTDSYSDGKKTAPNSRCLSFPRITSPAAVQRAQRHVPNSITTLRILLGLRLMLRLSLNHARIWPHTL